MAAAHASVQVSLAPLTDAARGVALALAATVAAVAGLTAAGVMRPAFPNEAPVVAGAFLLGALVAASAVWRREPQVRALGWALVNAILAALVLAFPVALGLALP